MSPRPATTRHRTTTAASSSSTSTPGSRRVAPACGRGRRRRPRPASRSAPTPRCCRSGCRSRTGPRCAPRRRVARLGRGDPRPVPRRGAGERRRRREQGLTRDRVRPGSRRAAERLTPRRRGTRLVAGRWPRSNVPAQRSSTPDRIAGRVQSRCRRRSGRRDRRTDHRALRELTVAATGSRCASGARPTDRRCSSGTRWAPSTSGAWLTELAPTLAATYGLRLVALDGPGFGGSPAMAPEHMSVATLADLAWGVADATGAGAAGADGPLLGRGGHDLRRRSAGRTTWPRWCCSTAGIWTTRTTRTRCRSSRSTTARPRSRAGWRCGQTWPHCTPTSRPTCDDRRPTCCSTPSSRPCGTRAGRLAGPGRGRRHGGRRAPRDGARTVQRALAGARRGRHAGPAAARRPAARAARTERRRRGADGGGAAAARHPGHGRLGPRPDR